MFHTHNILSPCKDCTDRHCACSDSCPKFKEYREELDAQKQWLKDTKYRFFPTHNRAFIHVSKSQRNRHLY